jgi:anaphase-promoting complex subunit 4
MEVRNRSRTRAEIPARVCLLGRDKAVYKMYALPEDWEAIADLPQATEVMMEESP